MFNAMDTALQLLELQRSDDRAGMNRVRAGLTSDQLEQIAEVVLGHLADRTVDEIEEATR